VLDQAIAAVTVLAPKVVRAWLAEVGVKTLYIEPGSPWENGYVESFSGKLWDELLSREVFYTLAEARVLIERWREHYNGAAALVVWLPTRRARGDRCWAALRSWKDPHRLWTYGRGKVIPCHGYPGRVGARR